MSGLSLTLPSIAYAAYLLILHSLVLYWKLFMRLTQFISRRQEFRCDELACYVAGSEPLIEGLKSINRSAAAVVTYWQSVIFPIVRNGHQPRVASGFAQFMIAPQIAQATARHLEEQIKNPTINPFDTHPPLSARIERARALGAATVEQNNEPAISLMDDLETLELELLRKLAPQLTATPLKLVGWDELGTEVYIPLWRSQTAAFESLLAKETIGGLPDVFKRLEPIASQLRDPPGLLLTRDQRLDRAAGMMQAALTLALIDRGWTLKTSPGYVRLDHDGLELEPGRVLPRLRTGEYSGTDWASFCEKAGIGAWPLATVGTEQI